MKKQILPLKFTDRGGAMWGNKSKQDKAVVPHAPPTASKHRPAEPFGLVLFEGVWCCFG